MGVGGGVLGEEEEYSIVQRWVLAGHHRRGESAVLREEKKYRWVQCPHEEHGTGSGGELG